MEQIYTAKIQHRGEWWIGWIREIPGVNCQVGIDYTKSNESCLIRCKVRSIGDILSS